MVLHVGLKDDHHIAHGVLRHAHGVRGGLEDGLHVDDDDDVADGGVSAEKAVKFEDLQEHHGEWVRYKVLLL